jgi:uncharacterized membrane protein YcaP (DUF421 family)
MWHDMYVEQIPLAEKVIRTIGVYALLMVLFRLTGKRGLAAMNTFDFIVIFLCPTSRKTPSSATTTRYSAG